MQQIMRLTLQRVSVPLQLVSLRAFCPPPSAAPDGYRWRAGKSGAARRAARLVAAARRGNVFVDPSSFKPKDDSLVGAAQQGVQTTLPPARHTRVRTAEFVKSSVSVAQCPPARYPEFAVIGRSNVGKSSLINMLTGRSSLAMVSKTPGKTRCINHFIINDAWYLVDLPGYGFARASKENVVSWNNFTREYFLERETLVSVLLLVDASIPPMPLDISCAEWFANAELPYTLVFTKADKRKKGVPPAEDNMAAFEEELLRAVGHLPPTLVTSSRSGKGKGEVLAHISQLRQLWNKTQTLP